MVKLFLVIAIAIAVALHMPLVGTDNCRGAAYTVGGDTNGGERMETRLHSAPVIILRAFTRSPCMMTENKRKYIN